MSLLAKFYNKKCALSLVLLPGFLGLSLVSNADATLEYAGDIMFDVNRYEGSLFAVEADENKGTESFLRRAKLNLRSKISESWRVKVSAEYSELRDEVRFEDVYLGIKLNSSLKMILGQFKEPAGLERTQSLKYQHFMERSLASNVFSFPRNTGVKLLKEGANWNAELSLVQVKPRDGAYDDGIALATRLALNPYLNKENSQFLHLGINYSSRDGVDERFDIDETLIAKSFGNVFRSPNYFADKIDTTGLEAAASYGKVLLQTEFFQQSIDERFGQNYKHDGYYLMAAWTLMGEQRQYRRGDMDFGNKVNNTLELSLRTSHVDTSNFGEGDVADVLSLSLNYFLSSRTRLVLEYETADIDSYDDGDLLSADGRALNARIQWVY